MPRIFPSVTVCSLFSLFAMQLAADGQQRWEELLLKDEFLEERDSVFAEVYGDLVANAAQVPVVSEALLDLAKFYHANGLGDLANRCYQQFDLPEASYLRATLALEAGRYDTALDLFQRIEPRSEFYADAQVRTAKCQSRLGQGETAKETMAKVWRRHPGHEGAAVGLARLKMQERDFEGARDVLIETLRRNGDAGDVALLLSAVFRRMGCEVESEEALALGQSLPRNGSNLDIAITGLEEWICDPYLLSCQADLYFTSLRFDAARELYQHGLQLYPKYSELWFGLAKLEFASDNRAVAFSTLHEALALADSRVQVFEVYVEELYRDKRYKAVLSALEGSGQKFKDTAKLYRLKGNCLLALGKVEQAESVFREGVDRFPNQYSLLLALGQLLAQSQPEMATVFLQRAYSLNPYELIVAKSYFYNLLEVENWDAACKSLGDLEALRPDESRFRADYLKARAGTEYASGNIDEWLSFSKDAYHLEADSLVGYEKAAGFLITRGDFENVIRLTNIAKEVYPKSVIPIKFEALARLNLGDFQGGIEALLIGKSKATELGDEGEARLFEGLLVKVEGEVAFAK